MWEFITTLNLQNVQILVNLDNFYIWILTRYLVVFLQFSFKFHQSWKYFGPNMKGEKNLCISDACLSPIVCRIYQLKCLIALFASLKWTIHLQTSPYVACCFIYWKWLGGNSLLYIPAWSVHPFCSLWPLGHLQWLGLEEQPSLLQSASP